MPPPTSLYLASRQAAALEVSAVVVEDPVTLQPVRVPVQMVVVLHSVLLAVEAGHIVEVEQSLTVCILQLCH